MRKQRPPMHYVSLLVEFLRGRPKLVFWTAALAQAALWIIVPSLVYSAPPGDVPLLLSNRQAEKRFGPVRAPDSRSATRPQRTRSRRLA